MFLQEKSESFSPMLYLGKLRSGEVKLLNTRAGELGPPSGFCSLQHEHLHTGSSTEHREHVPESNEDQYYTPNYTAGRKKSGQELQLVRSCSSSTILQSWNTVSSCKHFKWRRKLYKSPVSDARPFIRCFKCCCQYTGLCLHSIILFFQQIVFPELACDCLHALCSVNFLRNLPSPIIIQTTVIHRESWCFYYVTCP